MKYAVISDIHGNYPALLKVIEDAKLHKADKFIFLGDYIFDLPFSNEVIRCVSQIENAAYIAGNKEGYIDWLSKEDQSSWTHEQMGVIYQTYCELSPEAFSFISSLKEYEYVPLESGGQIYACHFANGLSQHTVYRYIQRSILQNPHKDATHEQFRKDFQTLLESEDFRAFAEKINAEVILMGHTHLQAYGYLGEKLVINPGSCGAPLDFDNRAAYTIFEETPTGFHVTEQRVKYDAETVIESAKTGLAYKRGKIWCELLFLTLRTGRDYPGLCREIASQLAASKGEIGGLFTNETWHEAYETLMSTWL